MNPIVARDDRASPDERERLVSRTVIPGAVPVGTTAQTGVTHRILNRLRQPGLRD